MPRCNHLTQLTSLQRLHELATLLAVGVLHLRKLRKRNGKTSDPAPESQDSPTTCLEVPAKTVLSVHAG